MEVVTLKNGKKAQVVETTGHYKDTKQKRELGRVGKKYTKKMYRFIKGGSDKKTIKNAILKRIDPSFFERHPDMAE